MFRDMAAELPLADTPALSAAKPTDAAAAAPEIWPALWMALCAPSCAALRMASLLVLTLVSQLAGDTERGLKRRRNKPPWRTVCGGTAIFLLFLLGGLSASLRCTSARDELV
jgi:hypothetical protein